MKTVEGGKTVEGAESRKTVWGSEGRKTVDSAKGRGSPVAMNTGGTRRWRAFLLPLMTTILLPFAVYYVLRAQDIAQWQALLLSGAIPAAHAVGTAVVRRRIEFFDLLVVALLVVSAVTSLISGSPRVLLLKDAAIPAVLGVWMLSSLFAARR
ncbi:hypothetical protein JCM4914_07120 [Streptomyces platensis subsp. malvinus]